MTPEVRLGAVEDTPKVSALWVDMVTELAPTLTPNVGAWEEMAKNLLASGIYFIFVAEVGNMCVAFLDCFTFFEPSTGKTHLVGQHFYCAPEYRGGTASGRLWAKAVRFAKDRGIHTLELCCFPEQQPMWKRHGFEPVRTMMRKITGGDHV